MVSALFNVRHGSCSLCGAEGVQLSQLNLTAGAEPRLERVRSNVHTGICEGCWWNVGVLLRRKTSYRSVSSVARGKA